MPTWAFHALVDILAQKRKETRDAGALAIIPSLSLRGLPLVDLGFLGGLPLDRGRRLRAVGDEEGSARGVVVVVGLLGNAAPEIRLAEVLHVEDGLAKP